MKYKAEVFCTFQFVAIHHWPDAPKSHEFLRHPHRHIFHVAAVAEVNHTDRDIEFINLKERLEDFVLFHYGSGGMLIGATSCEMIAETLLDKFPELNSVTVSEDNENGAVLTRRGNE